MQSDDELWELAKRSGIDFRIVKDIQRMAPPNSIVVIPARTPEQKFIHEDYS